MTDGKLPAVVDYRVHARNAAAMWEALAKGYGALLVGTEEVRIVAPSPYHALRAIVVDPDTNRETTLRAIADTVLGQSGVTRRVVEDPSGTLDLSALGLSPRYCMTVMAREPAPHPAAAPLPATAPLPAAGPRSDIEIVVASRPGEIAVAERILTAVFPPAPADVDLRGRIHPPRVLGLEGWWVWLAYRDAVPAAAAYTYHDGSSLGVYQVGTLAEHRGQGLARALMIEVLRACPGDLVTLTATDRGRPLYDSLGFRTLSDAVWWRPNHTGDDSDGGLR